MKTGAIISVTLTRPRAATLRNVADRLRVSPATVIRNVIANELTSELQSDVPGLGRDGTEVTFFVRIPIATYKDIQAAAVAAHVGATTWASAAVMGAMADVEDLVPS